MFIRANSDWLLSNKLDLLNSGIYDILSGADNEFEYDSAKLLVLMMILCLFLQRLHA